MEDVSELAVNHVPQAERIAWQGKPADTQLATAENVTFVSEVCVVVNKKCKTTCQTVLRNDK